jgi:hypothetical protein
MGALENLNKFANFKAMDVFIRIFFIINPEDYAYWSLFGRLSTIFKMVHSM